MRLMTLGCGGAPVPDQTQTPLTVEDQKTIAKDLIQKLRKGCPRACLAGGALFSWSHEELANDLDLFVYMPDWLSSSEMNKFLANLLGLSFLQSMSNEMYTSTGVTVNSVHHVYRLYYEGVEVQIICCSVDPMEVMHKFPYSHSQMCWDGEDTYYGEHHAMLRDFNIVIKNYETSQRYKEKIEPRLAEKGYTIANSSTDALDLMMEFMTKRKTGGL